ncbi:monocarboxylate transporter 10-like isoform X2 [Rhopilema esculentum]|uniref:monocarboxylate transporter 10-like isoform X2 n=1 Tax=Rhopilema esculentum TaxID=499914 RepID=UPI0031E04CDB
MRSAWTGSLSIAMTFLLTPITFRVFDLVGYRLSLLLGGTLIGLSLVATSFASSIFETYFTLGLMFAIGQSLCYFAPLLILPHYFKRKLSLAHGIVLCGSSLGGLAQAPGLGFILQKYGFSSGMRLSSVTALLIIAVSVLFKLPEESFGPNSLKCRKERKREITIKTEMEEIPLLRNYAYIIFVFAIMLVSFGVFIPFVHLVRLAMDTGISYSMAVFLPGITSIAQAVGNVGFGKLASLPNYSKISLCKWATIVIGIVTTFVPIFTSFIGLAAYSFLFGIADGSIATSTMLIIRDLITKEQFNRGYSAYLICNCIAILAGPPFAGMFNLLFALKNQA